MMLWWVDAVGSGERGAGSRNRSTGRAGWTAPCSLLPAPPVVPALREYDAERRRREEYELLGFLTACHPMDLWKEQLARLRPVPSPELRRHVGRSVLAAGMLTTAKPVHTAAGEPMEFATFDDGFGLIEAVLFPRVYRERGHVLFDQGPFVLRGVVEEEFGAVTLTVTGLDRLERVAGRSTEPAQPSRLTLSSARSPREPAG
jgi:DNA polymerase III alpha subunit